MNKRKENELEVVRLLNNMKDTQVTHSEEKFGKMCKYDAYGTAEGTKILVEVKQRKKFWAKPWIEVSKLKSLKEIAKSQNEEVNVYLVNSIEETGEHFVYDCKRLWNNGVRRTEKMNKTTDWSSGKVDKEIIEFNANEYVIELTSMKLGHLYEVK